MRTRDIWTVTGKLKKPYVAETFANKTWHAGNPSQPGWYPVWYEPDLYFGPRPKRTSDACISFWNGSRWSLLCHKTMTKEEVGKRLSKGLYLSFNSVVLWANKPRSWPNSRRV